MTVISPLSTELRILFYPNSPIEVDLQTVFYHFHFVILWNTYYYVFKSLQKYNLFLIRKYWTLKQICSLQIKTSFSDYCSLMTFKFLNVIRYILLKNAM